jgi:hypothetical protein
MGASPNHFQETQQMSKKHHRINPLCKVAKAAYKIMEIIATLLGCYFGLRDLCSLFLPSH